MATRSTLHNWNSKNQKCAITLQYIAQRAPVGKAYFFDYCCFSCI